MRTPRLDITYVTVLTGDPNVRQYAVYVHDDRREKDVLFGYVHAHSGPVHTFWDYSPSAARPRKTYPYGSRKAATDALLQAGILR